MLKKSDNLSEKWIGAKFGKLTVIGFGYNIARQNNTWLCKCDCGKEIEVLPGNAKAGRVNSCGCLQREKATKHGQRYTRLYTIWVDMRRRCGNPKCFNYSNYGGRGIRVCEEWQSFDKFKEWAESHGYNDNLSIDRINVNGNYEPSNCRWADIKCQSNNRRTTRYVTVYGEKMSVSEALDRYGQGLSADTFKKRIDKYGYTAEEALSKH